MSLEHNVSFQHCLLQHEDYLNLDNEEKVTLLEYCIRNEVDSKLAYSNNGPFSYEQAVRLLIFGVTDALGYDRLAKMASELQERARHRALEELLERLRTERKNEPT